ncbi:MAG: SUF system Fe-S cluster assembly protein [Bacteroidales bacterium]|nr:SUF system Fe-S cluster assembly protein [Bacteroidales bacterium]
MDLQKFEIENKVISALRMVFDPEIPVNIYDLGLIYNLQIDNQNNVNILMTLTTPNCPVAEDMPGMVMNEIKLIEGIGEVNVELTFEPPWDMDKLTDEAKLELGML